MTGRRVLVLGYQRTGQAVVRVLAARGARLRVADARPPATFTATPLPVGVEARFGEDGPELLADIDLVVPSPGVPRTAPVLAAAQARGIAVQSEIELAAQLLTCPLVAITGTNGKSTTTSVVGLALGRAGRRVFTGGNLGTPLISASEEPPEIAVAEVSSFQLEWVERFRPRVACLLNVTPDHLDRHASFAAYCAAKARLFAAQTSDDWAVLNREDPAVVEIGRRVPARVVTFGMTDAGSGASAAGDHLVLRLPGADEEQYSLARTRLTGGHNVENLLAAITVARLAGAPVAAVQAAIDAAAPLPHRLARVAERQGVLWIDDSKATNEGAAAKSIGSCSGPVILLAGGVDKGGSYEFLGRAAREKVRLALVFGAARARIAHVLAGVGVTVEQVATLDLAVRAAATHARPGDTVLLAPACSSFDQFTDYAARGRAFVAAVEALP